MCDEYITGQLHRRWLWKFPRRKHCRSNLDVVVLSENFKPAGPTGEGATVPHGHHVCVVPSVIIVTRGGVISNKVEVLAL